MVEMAWYTGPIRSLEIAIEEKDWFKGIVLSVTWLERYGCKGLKRHFASKQKQLRATRKIQKSLERLHLKEIALLLYGFGKISKENYDMMLEINSARNSAVHQTKDERKYFFTKEAEDKYEPLVRKAIECLKTLGVLQLRIMK